MNRWHALAGAAGLAMTLGAVPARAAPEAETEAPRLLAQAGPPARVEMHFDDGQPFAGEVLEAERPVKGAPYCADAVHETLQWLPDASGAAANRIVKRQQTRLCRDGEGRTRQEVERDGRRRIYLRDPVARESWVLDPEQHSARRLGAGGGHAGWPGMEHDSSAWREYAERMREWARNLSERMRGPAPAGGGQPANAMPAPPAPPVPPVPPSPPTPVVVTADGAGKHEMQVRIIRGDMPGLAGAELPLPPGMALRAGQLAPRGPGVVTALGSKEIEGLRAGGERTTWTIEAGKLGNEKPIVITREVWRSPDLLLTLSSSDYDPRSGETRYRLVNIKRGEPDPALMQVPADFKRREPASAASRSKG